VDDAFPGSTIAIRPDGPHMLLEMSQPGLLRPLSTAELSDGTLRYLLWVAALLTMRPPELMVLNEPETSLHPDLLPALGRLIARAAEHTQVIVVSHAPPLIDALSQQSKCHRVELAKEHGETVARLPETVDPEETVWKWPKR
jgi:predicted ATPase